MTISQNNYKEQSKRIDFSKLDSFFKDEHDNILTLIDTVGNMSGDNRVTVQTTIDEYMELLNMNLEMSPDAIKATKAQPKEAPKREPKKSEPKPKAKKEPKPKKEPKKKEPKPKAAPKGKAPKKGKHAYKTGQSLYWKNNVKAIIESCDHNDHNEPVYVVRYDKDKREKTFTQKTLKEQVAQGILSIDRPLPQAVESVSDDVKLLRRFKALHGKTKTKADVLTLLKALQAAIVSRKVRASSPYAVQLEEMQSDLIKLANASDDKVEIVFSKSRLDELTAICGGVATSPAVLVIEKFLAIQGKTGVKEKAETLLNIIENGRFTGVSQALKDNLQHVKQSLKKYVDGQTNTPVVSKATLNGLNGLAGLGGVDDYTTTDRKNSDIVSAAQFAGDVFVPMGITGKWKLLLGDVCEPFRIMFYGKGGGGKSTAAIEFANYLADSMGKDVLYVAKEEGLNATLQDKTRRTKANSPNLYFTGVIPASLDRYDVIVLDSADTLNLTPRDVLKMREKYPSKSFVTIHKVTKDGQFRGSKDWEHDCDTTVIINNGVAKADKNRFGGRGEIAVY